MSPAPTSGLPLTCLVEIPKGSRNKYEWDEALQGIKLDRFLFSSVVYPSDYGFITETCGEDGDPLDALVVVTQPTFPGCRIPVRVVAVLRMSDDKGQDDKVICVPESDPQWDDTEDLDDLPPQLRVEVEHFFSIYKQPEQLEIEVEIQGWEGREAATRIIEDSQARFQRGAGR